jgi:hypothetical protein
MAFSIHSLVLVAGLASATSVLAQTHPTNTQKPAQNQPDMGMEKAHYSLEQMKSCDVMLEPTAAEKRAADEKGKSPDRDKGKVKDLVISTRDGQVSGAAVSVGGMLGIGDKVVFVPTSNLHWNTTHKDPCWVLNMTEADLKALPAFDVDKADKEGLDRIVDARKDMPADATKAPASTPRYVLASKLDGCKTSATDKEIGKVHDGVVSSRNAVDYLVVSVGGVAGVGDKQVLAPYSAFAWTKDGDKCVLKLNKTSEELKNAPEFRKVDGVVTADQLKKADEYFGGKSPTRAD